MSRMDVGLMIRWGKLVPGREQAALDVFAEAIAYFGKKIEEKTVTFFEPYFFHTGDQETETGFMVVKGPAPEIFKLVEEEGFLVLMDKGFYTVEHLRWDLLTVGEGVGARIERGAKVRAELGI